MKLKPNVLETFSHSTYVSLLAKMEEDKKHAFTTLLLTVLALIVFGLFAINPTLSTIASLQKQLDDDKLVQQKLSDKITNLSLLQKKYESIQTDIPTVYNALPTASSVPRFTAQIQAIAKTTLVTITQMKTSGIDLTNNTPLEENAVLGKTSIPSFTFTLSATGTSDSINQFLQQITHFDRIITLDSLSLTGSQKDNALQLDVSGKTYFKS